MRAYELIKETFLRRSYILVVHVVWLAIYAVLFLLPVNDSLKWGKVPFFLCGFMLSLILSSGIFGNDIASGRITVLITKPMPISMLYIWRFVGLAIQGIMHLFFSGLIIFFLHSLTGKGSIQNLIFWLFLSWMLFNTWLALSITVSVFTRRGHNFMVLILGTLLVIALRTVLLMSPNPISKVLVATIRYIFPPVELLLACGQEAWLFPQKMRLFGYVIALIIVYAGIGITILANREFKRQND